MSLYNFDNQAREEKLELFSRVEAEFIDNGKHIFYEVIFANLFNDENKYSDASIFQKIEPYLKEYFKVIECDWEQIREKVFDVIKKTEFLNALISYLESNLKNYLENIIEFKFEGHFSDWLKIVIDRSIEEKKALTKQYARIVVASYYYKKFANASKDVLYKNLIAMISLEEFNTWIINDSICFERIIKKIEKRFNKIGILSVDEKVLITQIVNSKSFQQSSQNYDFIDANARLGKYSKIYNEIAKKEETNGIDLNAKNVFNNENTVELNKNRIVIPLKKQSIERNSDSIVKETNLLDKDFEIKECNIDKYENIEKSKNDFENITSIKNTIINDESNIRKGLDDFLLKIGNKKSKRKEPIVKFFESIEKELSSINEIDYSKFDNCTNVLCDDFDEDIQNLQYF